jgi:long-chain acyl-CoA synthetase
MRIRRFKPGRSYLLDQLSGRFRSVFSNRYQPENISQVLERVAVKYPTKDAVVCDNIRLTFSQLKEQTTRLETGLSALGITQGDWVAIMLSNCPEFVTSFLAIAKIGAIVVPVDIYYQQPELERLLHEGHITTLITSSEFLDTAEAAISKCSGFKNLILKESNAKDYPSIEDLLNTEEEIEKTTPKIKSQDDLLYLYTSGTTGMPKGVVLSHAKVIAIGRAWRNRFPITDDDKCYTLAPLFRSPALLSVVVAGLCSGITMVIPSAFRPLQVWEEIDFENISFFHANPFHFAALVNIPLDKKLNLPILKLCCSSGNRLSPRVKGRFLDRFGIRIEERYGTLEAGGICRNGYSLKGVRIKLIDEKGKKIKKKDRMGEIVVKTPMMVRGYHKLPELSSKVFRGGWFHTGDLGKIDQQGKLHIIYRKKTVVLIDGKEVYPDEVEQVLRGHPKVEDAMVVKDKLKPENVAIKAIVVLKESCSQGALLKFCRSRLATHKIPHLIEFREELPRSWKAVIDGMGQAYPMWGGG